VRARLIDFGLDILPRERHTPDALAAMQKADAEKFWPLIKEFGIKGERLKSGEISRKLRL